MEEFAESDTKLTPYRPSSPSPSIPATPAISSCPSSDRTFSTVSSLSASSATSVDGKSTTSASSRRRGYIRPQGVEFARSARTRESVMCLGSIAHLQYYFARTGLLDGRGGNTREWKKKKKQGDVPRLLLTPDDEKRFIPEIEGRRSQSPPVMTSPTMEEPESMEEDDEFNEYDEMMLPPTVSTYSIKTQFAPPPPDVMALRKDLVDALNRAEEALHRMESNNSDSSRSSLDDGPGDTEQQQTSSSTPGWDEIQGMHMLDVFTLAIRAAKIYYTSHECPERLAALKPEREIRQELLNVIELLKRWAARNFAGGLRNDERDLFQGWISHARILLAREEQQEEMEANQRENWEWAYGDWTGREREREESFLQSLMEANDNEPLPPWTSVFESSDVPTPFLERLRDGRDLVQMHNQAVKKSRRRFCQIENFHKDVAKPYRRAENLRYWIKAAEIRWEIKLDMNVMDVVQGNNAESWKQFEVALLLWCKTVREELTRDWIEARKAREDTGKFA